MKIKGLILGYAILSCMMVSCKFQNDSVTALSGSDFHDIQASQFTLADSIILMENLHELNYPKDQIIKMEPVIRKDWLMILVRYPGGCADHHFKLYGSPSFMESYPVQNNLFLAHDNNDDACSAIVSDTLIFNLYPLKQAYIDGYGSPGMVHLNLYAPGADEPFAPYLKYKIE
ncbi:MAG: hypothetical protein GF313_12980 [Caldithrix sp.]|nr:hypothetical protein [Caldithrix sp.]